MGRSPDQVYLQLAIRSEQICLSSGYSLRFMGQASVKETRILYSTDPKGKMRMYTLGMMILWKWPSFSFEKNKSGIHTRFASVNVKYFSRPGIDDEILLFTTAYETTMRWRISSQEADCVGVDVGGATA